MDQIEFLELYRQEKPIFQAWGEYLIKDINAELQSSGIDTNVFLKIPVIARVKDENSIIAKAFLRQDKHYTNPYEQITDKVGIRFVVLELSEISIIKDIIEKHSDWETSKDVDFETTRDEKPELFVYQSVHYIVRNCNELEYNGVAIPAQTPCEVQIRTLLQHAYAELSHQTVYKSNAQIDPTIKRKLARSMALIEATDELFKEVRGEMQSIDCLYLSFIEAAKKIHHFSHYVESLNSAIFDVYKTLINDCCISPKTVCDFLDSKSFILDRVEENVYSNILYDQPIIYLLYYLVSKHSSTTKELWPFDLSYIQPIYSDLGITMLT